MKLSTVLIAILALGLWGCGDFATSKSSTEVSNSQAQAEASETVDCEVSCEVVEGEIASFTQSCNGTAAIVKELNSLDQCDSIHEVVSTP